MTCPQIPPYARYRSPGDVVAALAGAKNGAALTLPNGTVALDRETLTALGRAAQADGMASISIASADKSSLTDAQRKYLPKNGTILNISAQVQPKNGTATRVHALNGTASVSVVYSLKSRRECRASGCILSC